MRTRQLSRRSMAEYSRLRTNINQRINRLSHRHMIGTPELRTRLGIGKYDTARNINMNPDISQAQFNQMIRDMRDLSKNTMAFNIRRNERGVVQTGRELRQRQEMIARDRRDVNKFRTNLSQAEKRFFPDDIQGVKLADFQVRQAIENLLQVGAVRGVDWADQVVQQSTWDRHVALMDEIEQAGHGHGFVVHENLFHIQALMQEMETVGVDTELVSFLRENMHDIDMMVLMRSDRIFERGFWYENQDEDPQIIESAIELLRERVEMFRGG